MKILMWLSIGLDRRTPSEHILTAIVEALYKEGHIVHILQKSTGGDKPTLPECMVHLGVTTTCVAQNPAAKSNFVGRYLADVQYVLKCRRYLKTLDFESGRNVPLTFNVQDIFPENAVYSHTMKKNSLTYKVLSAIQKKAYRDADSIITISEDMKDQLMELGTDGNKVSVIYNWSYQDEVYDPKKTVSEIVNQFMPGDTFKVVYAGNIGLMQNVEIVIEAADALKSTPDIMFYIFGSGLYRKKLEAKAEKLRLQNVIFHDMLPAELAPALYCKADVNIIPLAENIYRTALPSKTATCLACQKPIVFAIGKKSKFAIKMQQEAGCYIVDSGDVDALVGAISGIYNKCLPYRNRNFFMPCFQMGRNSVGYAKIITKDKKVCRNESFNC